MIAFVDIKHLGDQEPFFGEMLQNQENSTFKRKQLKTLNESIGENKYFEVLVKDFIKQYYNNNNDIEISLVIEYEEEENENTENQTLCKT